MGTPIQWIKCKSGQPLIRAEEGKYLLAIGQNGLLYLEEEVTSDKFVAYASLNLKVIERMGLTQ